MCQSSVCDSEWLFLAKERSLLRWMWEALSKLDSRLNGFEIEPQTPEQALANIRKLKTDLGLPGKKIGKRRLREIYKRTGSFTDEVLKAREKERT